MAGVPAAIWQAMVGPGGGALLKRDQTVDGDTSTNDCYTGPLQRPPLEPRALIPPWRPADGGWSQLPGQGPSPVMVRGPLLDRGSGGRGPSSDAKKPRAIAKNGLWLLPGENGVHGREIGQLGPIVALPPAALGWRSKRMARALCF